MTKMATMPIYGKNLAVRNQKAYDLETWYAASGTTKFVQMMTLGWPWVLYAFVWEKGKTTDFSETIVVNTCDIFLDSNREGWVFR